MPRTAIKGQAIADFVAEFMYLTKALGVTTDVSSTSERCTKDDEPTDPGNVWSLRIDGSSNMNGSGTSIVLESPIGEKINYALRLKFSASNNEAEYEALLAKLCLAKEMRMEQIKIYSDSQLVTNQINGDYQAKGENMVAYLKIAGGHMKVFKWFKIEPVPRVGNVEAEGLVRLASGLEDGALG